MGKKKLKRTNLKSLNNAEGLRVSEPEPEPEPEPVADLSIPELLDYTQRDESPYVTSPITFKVGKEYYTILQYYLHPFPILKCNPSELYREPDTYNEWSIRSQGPLYHLELTINPRAAHTFIHYLSTGQYETLQSVLPPIKNAADVTEALRARDIEELTRAAHTYAAAVLYEVPGLQELAQGFLGRFAQRLPTEDILKVLREIYDSLRDVEPARTWVEVFVRGCLEAAFSDREVSLRQIIGEYGIGMEGSFDRFIVDETLAIFERDREEVNQALGGLGEPEEMAELEPLSESPLVLDPEPELEAELASESESEPEPEPEPHEIEVEDRPMPEPVSEAEIVLDMDPGPIPGSNITPKTESRLWEDQPALQPLQSPEPEASVATQSLEDSLWTDAGPQ